MIVIFSFGDFFMPFEDIPQATVKQNLSIFQQISRKFPLHMMVWFNKPNDLKEKLTENKDDIEYKDPRGRSPLMLAIVLNHLDCVSVLIENGASVVTQTNGWSAVDEAAATRNEVLIKLILETLQFQIARNLLGAIPQFFLKMKEVSDFYVEVHFKVSTWVPFTGGLLPNETFRVYKSGLKVRIDILETSGTKSIILQINDNSGSMTILDHAKKTKTVKRTKEKSPVEDVSKKLEEIMKNPIVSMDVNYKNFNFERAKTSFLHLRTDKTEAVDGYKCDVFLASNFELRTRTRVENLSSNTKKLFLKTEKNLGKKDNEGQEGSQYLKDADSILPKQQVRSDGTVSLEEYFTADYDLKGRDIGIPKEMYTKVKRFKHKASLWMSKDYPLSLQEQIMPIIDLLAPSSFDITNIKDFLKNQLPPGFPVKIEIPIKYIVLINVMVTFNNIFAKKNPTLGVQVFENKEGLRCSIDESLFEIPSNYKSKDDPDPKDEAPSDVDDPDPEDRAPSNV